MPHHTILYAEDDATLRRTVSETLELEGWSVVTCDHGAATLALLEGGAHFDLLLLDNRLPGMSGLELTRRARTLAHRRHTPIIIFSATECGREAHRAGADGFLGKTDGILRLVETVAPLLAARGGA